MGVNPNILSSSNVELVKRLFRENFREYAGRYALVIVFMAIVALTTALTAWIVRDVVDSVFIEQDFEKSFYVGLFVILIFTVKGFASYGQLVTLAKVGNAIVAKLQLRMFDKVLTQSGAFYSKYPSNDLITRLAQNAHAARLVIDMLVTSLGRDVLTLIGLMIVMIIQDPFLSLIALSIAPPVIIAIATFVRRVRKAAKQQFDFNTKIVRATQDTVAGISIVKSFGMEKLMREKMGSAVHSVESRMNRIAALSARTSPLMETLGGLCLGAVIIYAGWSATDSGRSPAEFTAFLTAFLLAYDPAKRIARLHINLEAGLVGARLMYEVLDEPVVIMDKPGAKPLSLNKGAVNFKDVSFAYPGQEVDGQSDSKVLRNINFLAKGGETTAIVGPSGAGKSTVMALMQRFFDVREGEIKVDGQDIRDVSLSSLRNSVAFVSQNTFLFDGTVRENIAAGLSDASNEQIEQAAKIANAHDFIVQLENGYDAEVGENGLKLSGGQRQRVAIARAVLKDAPIVLLDEATSALDNESERLIQDAFEELSKGRTTIVIAHRLSTIMSADMIHVLKDGELVESGRHEELLAQDNVYKHLFEIQFRDGEK